MFTRALFFISLITLSLSTSADEYLEKGYAAYQKEQYSIAFK